MTLMLLLTSVFCLSRGAGAEGEDATPLLQRAAAAMANVKTFSFELSTVSGQATIFQNLELVGVEGSVVRPDRFRATVTAKVAFIEAKVDVIGIGSHVWATDPMSRSENYIELTNGPESGTSEAEIISALINPDRLLLSAVSMIENPTIDGTEKMDGKEVTRVVGTVDLAKLEQFATATPEFGSDLLILGKMPVTLWIDDGGYVLSLEVEGPLTTDESPDVVRRIDLFDFDQPITIEAPTPTA
jgi:hypothetical protein